MDLEKPQNFQKYRKKRNVLISYEDLYVDTWYAITLNPNDKRQHFTDTHRDSLFLSDLSKILYHSDKIYSYKLYPEVSPKGRLHWHGYIAVHDKNIFFVNAIPNIIRQCTVYMSCVGDKDEWNDYCNKQIDFHVMLTQDHYVYIPICRIKKDFTA